MNRREDEYCGTGTSRATYSVILASYIGHVNVVSGWTDVLILFVGENVQSDQVDFGVSMLASLGGTHLHDFAGTSLDHDVSILAQC